MEHYEREGKISKKEQRIVDEILSLNPDCLAYWSVAYKGGVNYLFFEKGFKKTIN